MNDQYWIRIRNHFVGEQVKETKKNKFGLATTHLDDIHHF